LDKGAGDVHNNLFSDSKFRENHSSAMHISLRGVNAFISYLPHLLEHIVKPDKTYLHTVLFNITIFVKNGAGSVILSV
jgi:hypothetical protein